MPLPAAAMLSTSAARTVFGAGLMAGMASGQNSAVMTKAPSR